MKPVVAIVGRPNVGKSTLFNRITRTREALVDDAPGVTRDRHYADAEWDGIPFTLVDTGGFLAGDADPFSGQIRAQVLQAIQDADTVILLMDGKAGISPYDREMALLLRETDKPVFFAVNKIDHPEQEAGAYEFHGLGVDSIYPVSSAHGYGVSDLLDDLVDSLPAPKDEEAPEGVVRVAVVGRPNVGKSSLINHILGEQRMIVGETPGTTRDSIDVSIQREDKRYRFVDTAGIRKKRRASPKIEKFSVVKALKSLDRCDVALILVDAEEGVTQQDVTVAGYAYQRRCGVIFLLNKWDLVEKTKDSLKMYTDWLRRESKFLHFAPVLSVSAKTGQRTGKIFPLIDQVYEQYTRRLGTGQVNRILEQALQRREPSLHKGKRLKFYYATQVSTRPPTFVFFVNYPEGVHFSYQRFLINRVREEAGLDKTPVHAIFRQRTGRIEFGDRPSRKKAAVRRRKSRR